MKTVQDTEVEIELLKGTQSEMKLNSEVSLMNRLQGVEERLSGVEEKLEEMESISQRKC